MKLKKFLCLFLGLLVISALIVPVSAGSLDAYFSSGGEKEYRFVSGKENWYKRSWAEMGDCKTNYYLRAYLGDHKQDAGKKWVKNPIPSKWRLNSGWEITGEGLSGNLGTYFLRAYAFYGVR